jgi:hypothetical protein
MRKQQVAWHSVKRLAEVHEHSMQHLAPCLVLADAMVEGEQLVSTGVHAPEACLLRCP